MNLTGDTSAASERRLVPVDAAGQDPVGDPGLVALGAVAAVGPDLAAVVLPVDADMAFVAEHRDGEHRQWRAVFR